MDKLILMPAEELIKQIREVIKEEVQVEQQKNVAAQLLSPAETCKIFSPAISKVTLQAWTAAGHLTRYEIGGRVYYRYSEVIEAAKNLKKYKTQKR